MHLHVSVCSHLKNSNVKKKYMLASRHTYMVIVGMLVRTVMTICKGFTDERRKK